MIIDAACHYLIRTVCEGFNGSYVKRLSRIEAIDHRRNIIMGLLDVIFVIKTLHLVKDKRCNH